MAGQVNPPAQFNPQNLTNSYANIGNAFNTLQNESAAVAHEFGPLANAPPVAVVVIQQQLQQILNTLTQVNNNIVTLNAEYESLPTLGNFLIAIGLTITRPGSEILESSPCVMHSRRCSTLGPTSLSLDSPGIFDNLMASVSIRAPFRCVD